jgi:DNA-binding FadR family transcriptional regulator
MKKKSAKSHPRPPRRPKLRVPKAAEVLAAHLRQRIIRGELKEGDRLPKEQQLIEQFGVSRSTFREAFVLLAADGLISVSRGARNGALVHRPNIKAASRQMNFIMQANNVTLDDVYRSLGVFEPAVVRALAETGSKADIRVLREQVARMHAVVDDDRAFGELAAQFHRTLAERAGLKTIALMMELLADLVGAYVESSSASQPPNINRTGKLKAIRARERLMDLLEKRDADGAEALWREHFEVTREVMLRCQPTKAVQDVYELR